MVDHPNIIIEIRPAVSVIHVRAIRRPYRVFAFEIEYFFNVSCGEEMDHGVIHKCLLPYNGAERFEVIAHGSVVLGLGVWPEYSKLPAGPNDREGHGSRYVSDALRAIGGIPSVAPFENGPQNGNGVSGQKHEELGHVFDPRIDLKCNKRNVKRYKLTVDHHF